MIRLLVDILLVDHNGKTNNNNNKYVALFQVRDESENSRVAIKIQRTQVLEERKPTRERNVVLRKRN